MQNIFFERTVNKYLQSVSNYVCFVLLFEPLSRVVTKVDL
jgi:hypothetical protein